MNRLLPLLLLLCTASLAVAQPVVWDGTHESASIGRQVAVLEDPAGRLRIDQVSSAAFAGRFQQSERDLLQFGFSESVRWVRFSVRNLTRQSLWLEMQQAYLPTADLYVRDARGQWQVYKAGYQVPLQQKVVNNIYQVFPLPATPDPVYIRYVSYSQPVRLNLWHDQAFQMKADRQLLTYGLVVGLLLFVIINNLFLFFSLRRFTYLHYALLVLTYILNAAGVMEGFSLYLFPDQDVRFWFLLLPNLSGAVSVSFSIWFLELKKYTPRLYRFGLVVLAYCVSYCVWYQYLPHMVAEPLNQAQAFFVLTVDIVFGIQAARAGNRTGYYYTICYIGYCLLLFVEIIYIQTGWPPHQTEVSHVVVAMCLEALALAYVLSLRFNWEQQAAEAAKTEAQGQLLQQTHENERILQAQNETLERQVADRTQAIEQKKRELEQSLQELHTMQAQLIQKEKLASLGELTAGIAHEIQNPLNFVNNFAELSTELIDELEAEARAGRPDEVLDLAGSLKVNLQKIHHHGGRAASIVRGMLEHSRADTGQKRPTNLNALADEYLKIAYHGLRAKDKSFNTELVTKFTPDLGRVDVVPQDTGRVLLNLFNNAFYAVQQRQTSGAAGYQPIVEVRTRQLAKAVEIQVCDNGTGIPDAVKAKIFQPFFTTKPTGEGTGLGLSLSYDIITKGHGGTLSVDSSPGEGTTFTIVLPA